jgi:hypothetical protein
MGAGVEEVEYPAWFGLHSVMTGRWADDLRLSDIEPRFVCIAGESAALKCGLQLEQDGGRRDGLALM